jgi:shikimate dehydrogenase
MKVFGLIGFPLGHSFSQQYFTEKFIREGITDCRFDIFPISSIQLFPELLQNNPSLCGLCVTIPYKEQVLAYVDIQSEEVKAIGATNSIHFYNNKLIAYNTDIIGFEQSFCKLLQPHHKKALVLGTGGASKAVQYVLRKLGIGYLKVTRSNDLAEGQINYNKIDAAVINEYNIVVNCSPVGMHPNENIMPLLPYEYIGKNHYFFDLVYKPANTLFLQQGEKRRAVTQNGFEMLVLQAEASWRIWNDG